MTCTVYLMADNKVKMSYAQLLTSPQVGMEVRIPTGRGQIVQVLPWYKHQTCSCPDKLVLVEEIS